MDVKSTFLNGPLDEVSMNQPPSFMKKGQEQKVYKLKKTLYKLKQALRACDKRIDSFMLNQGF